MLHDHVLQRTVRTARVTHDCDCGKAIAVGESYLYVFGFNDRSQPYQSKVSQEHRHARDDRDPAPRKMTRAERLEGQGIDTWEDYYEIYGD